MIDICFLLIKNVNPVVMRQVMRIRKIQLPDVFLDVRLNSYNVKLREIGTNAKGIFFP